MIFSDVRTHYITGNKDNHLVRYDVIKLDEMTFMIKVIGEQRRDRPAQGSLNEIAAFKITREEYKSEHKIGTMCVIKNQMPPSFEKHILEKCQQHRDSLN